jgi:NAD(P)H dehydrogenase (quinone)
VTGASGALGSRVARILSERGVESRLIVREAARAPQLLGADVAIARGYDDRAAMTAAFRGADAVFLVSGRESSKRVADHASAVAAAVDAGVRRIVYTSFLGAAPGATFTLAREHFATEQFIRNSGRAFTFLRNSLYVDYVPFLASAQGVIAGPAGTGKVACVSRDDVAAVAANVLLTAGHDGETYDVTGGAAFTLAAAAAELATFTRRAVTYKAETLEEAYASRSSYAVPQSEVDGWVTSYVAIARGEMDIVSDVVPRLTGRPAQTLSQFLREHPESYAHLL